MFKKYLSIILILFSFFGCATGGKGERAALKKYVQTGQYQEALKYLKKNKFYNEKDVQLLTQMEIGLVEHISGNYYQSILALNKAKVIHNKLFTKSISKKMKTYIANDNYDQYYGFTYERSLIHFYLSLNHYLLFQKGSRNSYEMKDEKQIVTTVALTRSEKRNELMGARAELLDWDSYLESIAHKRMGRSVFKIDLLAKTYGAFIHESVGSLVDKRIALQLYKDAKKTLFRNYNSYPTFNNKNVEFKKDFKKLPEMKKSKVENHYISKTFFQNDLKNFLDLKILTLTKYLNPKEIRNEIKRHKPSKDVLKQFKKLGKKQANLGIIFQRGFIPQKIAAKQYYGLKAVLSDPNASAGAKAAAAIGSIALTVFAANQLGLMPPPARWSPVGARMGIHVAAAAVDHTAIAFELPEIKNVAIVEKLYIEFYDEKGSLVARQAAPLINPMGDIAAEAVAEDSAARYTRVGVRLATKHIVAILAAHQLYQSQKKSWGKAAARSLAVISYIAASKGIERSEQADTRYWSTLPGDIRFVDMYIPNGKYQVKASLVKLVNDGNEVETKKLYDLGNINIKGNKKTLINFRSL